MIRSGQIAGAASALIAFTIACGHANDSTSDSTIDDATPAAALATSEPSSVREQSPQAGAEASRLSDRAPRVDPPLSLNDRSRESFTDEDFASFYADSDRAQLVRLRRELRTAWWDARRLAANALLEQGRYEEHDHGVDHRCGFMTAANDYVHEFKTSGKQVARVVYVSAKEFPREHSLERELNWIARRIDDLKR